MHASSMPRRGRRLSRRVRELAQTNLQLYEQLSSLEWSPTDLAVVRDAYELAVRLFSGRYRASGKTFVAHVVGTASCAAAAGASPHAVAAGLVHAVYEQGDFGPDAVVDSKRARVVAALGTDIEGLVTVYTSTPWDRRAIESLRDRAADLSPQTREAVLLRLANDVDDLVGCGAEIADERGRELRAEGAVDLRVQLARALDLDELADLLEGVSREAIGAPAVVHTQLTRSVLHPPASYRRVHTLRSVGRAVRRRWDAFRP
jgi:(p)ppGpp synthase/HD superfamily hydrolase